MAAAQDNSGDVIVVGAGLAGLVCATELAERGKRVFLLDQESEAFLGGQAYWSLGGLFMVDTPEQRRMGIRDSLDLATRDWMDTAGFGGAEDAPQRAAARAYLQFAAGEMRPWLQGLGLRWFPAVGWAERGAGHAIGHGNSVPRMHLTWGTGPAVLAPFLARLNAARAEGKIRLCCRHQVSHIIIQGGVVKGVSGEVLSEDNAPRGAKTSRHEVGEFELYAPSVVVASGGFGGNSEMVRQHWPDDRFGPCPDSVLSGVPFHVDGRMLKVAQTAGGRLARADHMWHYPDGIANPDAIWPNEGVKLISGPSPLWFDAFGDRLPAPCWPGFNTPAALAAILASGQPYSWLVMSRKIFDKELAVSGSVQNPDLMAGTWGAVLKGRFAGGDSGAAWLAELKGKSPDFVEAETLAALVEGMNRIGTVAVDETRMRRQIEARDAQCDNGFGKDGQQQAILAARGYLGDRLLRVTKPHRILERENGPLIAVRLSVMTRKSLGGLVAGAEGQLLNAQGDALPGLFAIGEAAGFGGGGYHGKAALEGTFLGGCLYTGRQTGRSTLVA